MSGQDQKISDGHSLQKMRREIEVFQAVAKLSPVIRLFGKTGRKMAEALDQVPDLAAQITRLSAIPDRFNDLFADRGWIVYELLNLEVMEKAVALGEEDAMEKAEELLADYYDEKTIRWQLMMLRGIGSFELRMPLAEKALVDYLAGRYHACVPVVLMIFDGFASDVGKVNRGPFDKDIDLTAWNSISAHNNGLNRLVRTLGQKRLKTRTEAITVPYRHGILHGRDLNYDNKLVAAKCWAALFALRDWAIARRDERGPKPEKTSSLKEIIQGIAKTEQFKRSIDAWRPRSETEQRSIPRDGAATDYAEGTPERFLVEFLEVWKRGNYGSMARFFPLSRGEQMARRPAQIRRDVQGRTLDGYSIVGVKDSAAAISIVTVELRMRNVETDEVSVNTKDVRLIFQNESGEPMARGMEGGQWWLVSFEIFW